MSKVSQVHQGTKETPGAFLERLIKVYKTYTPLDLEASEKRSTVSLAFVNQSALDIGCKLQRLEDFEGKMLAELNADAEKVFNNRETLEERWTRRLTKALDKQTQGLIHQGPLGCIRQS